MKLIKITVKSEWVDEETGEVFTDERVLTDETIKVKKASTSRKKKEEDNDPTPKLTLEDTKYLLNNAAIAALGIEAGDKLDIKYQKVEGFNSKMPIIGPSKIFQTQGGNKLSKSNTVICRGTGNDRLSEFGHNFTLTAHPHNDQLFVLNGDAVKEQIVPEELEIKEDADVDNLIDSLDSENIDKEEISSDDFDFTF